jgi:cytidyltransferase-like protein
MKSFKLFFEKVGNFSIGFFPGAFKPPHKGHFQTAVQAAAENDSVVILVSGSDREGITTDKAFQVWKVYKKYLPKNVSILNVSGSPITTIYQVVDIINNGTFTSTAKTLAPTPDAKNISEMFVNIAGDKDINLYASEEDAGRYDAFFNPNKSMIYKGKNVQNINRKNVSRLASATIVRKALQDKNEQEFYKFLPDISQSDKQHIYGLFV